jgi:hypothetical protein
MKILVQSNEIRTFCLIMLLTLVFTQSCEIAGELTGASAAIDKIEGEWSCDEQSSIYKATAEIYAVFISQDPDNASGVIIDNFYGLQTAAKANVVGMSLIISNQTLEGGFVVSGSGIISSDYKEIDMTYKVDDGSGMIDNVTAIYTKE